MRTDQNCTIKELSEILMSFSKERQWEKNYHPNQLAKSVIIEAAELIEIFQWIDNEKIYGMIKNPLEKTKIEFEIADVLYYLFMLAYILEIDLTKSTLLKLENLSERYPKVK